MATTALCGSDAVLTGIAGATEMQSWNINRTVDAQNATSMASGGWAELIACLKGATGTVKCLHAFDTGAYTLSAVTGVGKLSISGKIIVSKVTCDVPVEGLVTWTGDFSMTGAITVSGSG
jgi:hypothetical protein